MPAKHLKKADDTGVTIVFSDGEQLRVEMTELPEDIIRRLAIHGLAQKLGDAYAGVREPEAARAAAAAVADRLRRGEWRKAGEAAGPKISDLATAFAEAAGIDVGEAAQRIADLDRSQRAELRKHPQIAAILARIAAERAAKRAEAAGEAAPNVMDLIAGA